ncbi:MAG TPA: choice-of-anchor D domain-containing protein, partial [Symbiobacteriaceae bacterium]|nr:choice-of-anchor D domain-containing protein [Symbiobacteriaceae bacterium]
ALLAGAWDLAPWRAEAAAHFTAWVEEHREDIELVLPLLAQILHLLGEAAKSGQWVDVLRLGKAVEPAVALSGRWGVWQHLLERLLLKAAESVGDKQATAYALHQIGTRSLCMGRGEARAYLERALALRKALGDTSGAAVTGANLALAPAAPAVPGLKGRPRWMRAAGGLVALGLAGAALWGGLRLLGGQDGDRPEPPVTTPAAPVLKTERLDFGRTRVGTTSGRLTAELANEGGTPLKVKDVSVVGFDVREFPVVENTCTAAPVAPGGRCSVTVAFAPTAPRPYQAELVFEPDGAPALRTTLTGLGLQGVGQITPALVDFQSQLVGTPNRERASVVLTNIGTDNLMGMRPAIVGTHAGDFRVASSTCTETQVLAPGNSCLVYLEFRPTERGDRAAVLEFDSSLQVPLQGKGINPVATVSPREIAFRFGTFPVLAGTVTISNTGDDDLLIKEVRVMGKSPHHFIVEQKSCAGRWLTPGAICKVTVTWSPGQEPWADGTLGLLTNGKTIGGVLLDVPGGN